MLEEVGGISCGFGRLGVGITMPKSRAFPSNFGWTVNVSDLPSGPRQRNAQRRLQDIGVLGGEGEQAGHPRLCMQAEQTKNANKRA